VYLSSAITLGPWRKKGGLKGRKGGKFDHRPGRPKVLLRHCRLVRVLLQLISQPRCFY